MNQSKPLAYFAPLLPWQHDIWNTLAESINSNERNLSHALLAAGRKGIGKRELIWRWIAWQFCDNKQGLDACQQCQSCKWLQAGTHPDLRILPEMCSPTFEQNKSDNNQSKKKSNKTSTKKIVSTPKIKIDDIRDIQDFVSQSSQGTRICVFDYAETMTLGAANALLKTLEEPNANVLLIVITDKPSQLLPTISSRVQKVPLDKINIHQATEYLTNYLSHNKDNISLNSDISAEVRQLLQLTAYAPLASINLAETPWYSMRKTWLTTWLALRSGSRDAISASDYWQKQLELDDFIALTKIMLDDIMRLSLGFETYQQDIGLESIDKHRLPSQQALNDFLIVINEILDSKKQNVQDKFAYDMLLQSIENL